MIPILWNDLSDELKEEFNWYKANEQFGMFLK